jgi:hypothetical protein
MNFSQTHLKNIEEEGTLPNSVLPNANDRQ